MPHLFDHLDIVREVLALSPFGLITDVDGTISEIAPSPGEARVSPLCRRYLAALAKRLELVAVISGRPVEEVRRMVGIEKMVYLGNYGLETWTNGVLEVWEGAQAYGSKIKSAIEALAGLLSIEGLFFENKGSTASIHYRRCPDPEAARGEIVAALSGLPRARGLRITEGKMVVELRPQLEVNKGSALRYLIERYRLQGVIYIGDDISDIDAFRAIHDSLIKGLGIGVVGEETSPRVDEEADFAVDGVGGVERFLKWLVGVPA